MTEVPFQALCVHHVHVSRVTVEHDRKNISGRMIVNVDVRFSRASEESEYAGQEKHGHRTELARCMRRRAGYDKSNISGQKFIVWRFHRSG